ncbi:MAG: PAS domain S-box protein [Methylotenera sp.]|uniref:PAS domain-containing sensor histidine kinase n=1 Tax=Methylotenera sp. TaxID=2051956 RepID=UPI002487A7F8|nr:PAS domain S-box protein [Methylotenera sp.]MDI1307990.1 PAS domain S-box protein [Methylotenera sp.]
MVNDSFLSNLSVKTLFDAAADAMLLVDESGRVVQANEVALNLLDYSFEQINGLEIEALMPNSYRNQHSLHRNTYAKNPEKRPMGKGRDLIALRRDGSELAVDISLSPIKTGDRQFVLATLHIADKRRKVEEALKISEERLRLAKEAAGLGVFDFDYRNNIIHWDERMRDIWGEESEETVSYKKFVAAIHPDDRAARQTVIERAIDPASNGEYSVDYRVRNANDGVERWITTMGRIHFTNGQATRLLGIARDITDQKILEKTLQEQRAEMESLFKQQVAYQTVSAIAHELNQPLAAISAYSEVALHALDSNNFNSENLKRALEGAVTQAQRAGKSLHELLAFMQKGELVTERFELNHVLNEALNIAKGDGYGDFSPLLSLEPALPEVLGNETQVRKILVNLLRNAVEAMRGASVPSSAISITVRTNQKINMAHVTIQDSGPGLDAETARHIFEPFFTTKPTGIGMGLAISRALTEANGGQLWLEHNNKPGATFHFTLPFAG